MAGMRCALMMFGLALCVPARGDAREADGPRSTLSWTRLPAAHGCPGTAEVARRVDALLRRGAFVAPQLATQVFQVTVDRQSDSATWQITIVIVDDAGLQLGARELSIERLECSEAVDATALTLALMIDPDFEQSVVAFPPQPSETAEAAPPAMPESAPVARPHPAPRVIESATPVGWRTRLGLGALVVVGVLPKPGWGVVTDVRVSSPASGWGMMLELGYVGEQQLSVRPGAGAELDSTVGGLAASWRRRFRQIDASVVLGLNAWRLRGCGFGFSASNGCGSSWLAGAQFGTELVWRPGGAWGLALRPSVGLPVLHDSFEVTAADGSAAPISGATRIAAWMTLGMVVEP